MKIDYDLILPTDNSEDFGYKKPDGNWTGLIGKMSLVPSRAYLLTSIALLLDDTTRCIIVDCSVLLFKGNFHQMLF